MRRPPSPVRMSELNVYSRPRPPQNNCRNEWNSSAELIDEYASPAVAALCRRGRMRPARRMMVPAAVDLVVMIDGHGSLQVNDGQEHEDERLQPAGHQSQEHHRQRREKRHDAEQDDDDGLLAEDVAEQAERQRERP